MTNSRLIFFPQQQPQHLVQQHVHNSGSPHQPQHPMPHMVHSPHNPPAVAPQQHPPHPQHARPHSRTPPHAYGGAPPPQRQGPPPGAMPNGPKPQINGDAKQMALQRPPRNVYPSPGPNVPVYQEPPLPQQPVPKPEQMNHMMRHRDETVKVGGLGEV